tara:strand:+ start:58 stop:321 length:264 start_codon:yes stop_codon:yes gene_type:complete
MWAKLASSKTAILGAGAASAPLVVLAVWALCKAGGLAMSPADLDLLTAIATWGAAGGAVGSGANSLRHVGEGWRTAPAAAEGAVGAS